MSENPNVLVAAALMRFAEAMERQNALERRRQLEASRERGQRTVAEGRPVKQQAREYDSLDRLVPHRLDALSFAHAIPGYLDHFPGQVPPTMFAKVSVDEVEVSCPCGESHVVPVGLHTGASCGRHFIYDGDVVRVAPAEAAAAD